MKFKKGDKVKVVYGKDNGREGVIDRTYRKLDKVIIPGINVYKKHIKKTEQTPQGGVVELPRPIDASKVMLICPKCSKMTRIGYEIKNNKKYRVCRKCDNRI